MVRNGPSRNGLPRPTATVLNNPIVVSASALAQAVTPSGLMARWDSSPRGLPHGKPVDPVGRVVGLESIVGGRIVRVSTVCPTGQGRGHSWRADVDVLIGQ